MEMLAFTARKSTQSFFIALHAARDLGRIGVDLDQLRGSKLTRCWSGGSRHVCQCTKQPLEGSQAVLYGCKLFVAQRNLLAHAQQVLLAFEDLGFRGSLRPIVWALGTGHSVGASVEEIV